MSHSLFLERERENEVESNRVCKLSVKMIWILDAQVLFFNGPAHGTTYIPAHQWGWGKRKGLLISEGHAKKVRVTGS